VVLDGTLKGYTGTGDPVIDPYRGRNKPTWRILRKLRCFPWRAGQSAKPATSSRPAKSEDENAQCTGDRAHSTRRPDR
jgi:hypothetical protein